MNILKKSRDGSTTRSLNSVLRRAADAVTNLAHENSNIKVRVRYVLLTKKDPLIIFWCFSSFLLLPIEIGTCRMEGGIPPLVELLDFTDTKVQRAAAGALRTLAFKNDENKNQVTQVH